MNTKKAEMIFTTLAQINDWRTAKDLTTYTHHGASKTRPHSMTFSAREICNLLKPLIATGQVEKRKCVASYKYDISQYRAKPTTLSTSPVDGGT